MGQIWILANMPQRANKLTRQKAAGISVVDSCQQIIKPVAPLALRLQAILLKGIVTLHLRQLVFLEMDAENAVARFKSQCEAAQQEDQHVLAKKKSSARPDQVRVTDEVGALEMLELLDFAAMNGEDSYFPGQSLGDSHFFVDSQALRELEAEERRQTGGGPAWRTRGTRNDIDLPDDDLVSVGGEDSLSRGGATTFSGGHRSAFAHPDEEEFAVLPEDVDMEEDPFAVPGAARARSDTSGRSPFSELNAGAQPLPRIGEDDFDMAPPPPPPPPDEDEDDGSPQEGKAKRKTSTGKAQKKRGILKTAPKQDSTISLSGDVIREWLSDTADVVCVRSKVGDAPPAGKLSARLDEAMLTPSMLLLAPGGGAGKRGRVLCDELAQLFARHTKAPTRRRGNAPASPSSSSEHAAGAGDEDQEAMPPAGEDEEVEAFREAQLGRSPSASTQAGAAPGFGRRSNISGGGSASALAAALAGESPGSVRTGGGGAAGGRLSDAFGGGVREEDLPEEEGAAPFFQEHSGGALGLSRQFGGSALGVESQQLDASVPPPHPAGGLSGVSAGVAAYFGAAFGRESEEPDKAFLFDDLCFNNSLSRTQSAQLFAQILILCSAGVVAVQQLAPYAAITIIKGTVPMR